MRPHQLQAATRTHHVGEIRGRARGGLARADLRGGQPHRCHERHGIRHLSNMSHEEPPQVRGRRAAGVRSGGHDRPPEYPGKARARISSGIIRHAPGADVASEMPAACECGAWSPARAACAAFEQAAPGARGRRPAVTQRRVGRRCGVRGIAIGSCRTGGRCRSRLRGGAPSPPAGRPSRARRCAAGRPGSTPAPS